MVGRTCYKLSLCLESVTNIDLMLALINVHHLSLFLCEKGLAFVHVSLCVCRCFCVCVCLHIYACVHVFV